MFIPILGALENALTYINSPLTSINSPYALHAGLAITKCHIVLQDHRTAHAFAAGSENNPPRQDHLIALQYANDISRTLNAYLSPENKRHVLESLRLEWNRKNAKNLLTRYRQGTLSPRAKNTIPDNFKEPASFSPSSFREAARLTFLLDLAISLDEEI